jgi:hypothetical protein
MQAKSLINHTIETSNPQFQGLSRHERDLQEKIDAVTLKCARVIGPLSERERALVALALNQILI